mmetsp:Transcript_18578/g.25771  ORF Transcript_18578/g.25771 Transcript_18578/m.25771 type:complete len:268 (-) Transcript_18578:170-973(-)
MLCDAALVANFVATAMMNGVCCIHSMQEEEKNRQKDADTLTAAIRVEWERQRQMDKEHREQLVEDARREAALQIRVAEERRRNVIAAKKRAANMNKSGGSMSVGGRHVYQSDNSVSIHTMPGKTSMHNYRRGASLPTEEDPLQVSATIHNNPKSPSNIAYSPRRVNSSPAIVGHRRRQQQPQKLQQEDRDEQFISGHNKENIFDSVQSLSQQQEEQEQYVMDDNFPLIVQNTPAQRHRFDSEMSSLVDEMEDEEDGGIDYSYSMGEH